MKWISATEITAWADKDPRQCQEKLPELLRRLIQATAPSIQRIDFPCDSSVATGGWDGHLETVSQTPFFPDGTSKWEMGSEKSPGKKADDDYAKRKKNPLGAIPADTTYVAVTTRSWPGRTTWESAKKAEGYWKDVRAIGVDSIELWLASAPAVALWFARLISKAPQGMRDIEAMWEEWSVATNPALTPDIVISGRIDERDDLQKWLLGAAAVFKMQGDSPDESFAFLYASIMVLPEEQRQTALSRCVVVENLQQLRDCYQTFSSPLIIAAPAECFEGAGMAVNKGHHVFLSMDATTIDLGGILRLTRPKREIMQKALQSAGFSEADAQKLMRDSGRSIPVIRRRRLRAGLAKAPAWAETSAAPTLLPALLAGAWTEHKEGDQKIIEALSGIPYKDFFKQLTPFVSADDAPLRKTANVWMLKSPLDAWFLVAHHLDTDHFERFRTAINSVLTETDPKYELPADKRWAAGMYGKTSSYSQWTRRGLVESLVLLAVYGERISEAINYPQSFADSVVKDVLNGADSWQAWASLKDIMPLLAEAAPDAFLDALEEKIDSHPNLFKELMQDEENKFGFGDCQHAGLLWALESIAWHPDYILRVAENLLLLVQLDPGGKWSNRPLASLGDILLPGFPQTHAKPEIRIVAYNMLIERNPGIAWKIAEKHLTDGVISPSHTFRWRDTGGDRAGLDAESRDDHLRYLNAMLPKWAELACITPENIASAVENLLQMPDQVRSRVIERLSQAQFDSFSKEERASILHSLRHVLNWINNYDEKDEHKHYLPALRKIYEVLTPTDTLERIDWLFAEGWPRLPDEPRASEDHEKRLAEARKEAARDLLDHVGLQAIVDYGITLNYPAIFTHALATAIKDEKEDAELVNVLIGVISKTPWLLVGYAMGRVEINGNKWVEEHIKRLKQSGHYSPEAAAALFRGVPESKQAWTSVAKHGQEVEQAYWKWASGFARSDKTKSEDAAFAVEKLLSGGRADTALNIAGDPHVSLPSDLLQCLLLAVLDLPVDRSKYLDGTMLEFHLTNIFNQLYARKELSLEDIGKLEWPYAQVFDQSRRRTEGPMALHRTLQNDPAFFIELVSYLYKKDNGKEGIPEGLTKERAASIAENAHKVLESWYLVPGLKDDGSVDERALSQWLDEARKIAGSKGYLIGCDLRLAEILARVPPEKDGMWPHIALRNIIERIKNTTIEKHIPYAIYNSRGVRSRGLFEGGNQERTLSQSYYEWAKTMYPKWPRTAKMLRHLGDMLHRDAEREDIDSKLRDLET